MKSRDVPRRSPRRRFPALLALLGAAMLMLPLALRAQQKPALIVEEDCQVFAIAQDNRIVYAVPRMKRIKKIVIERDDIGIATPGGKTKRIVEADKFMPVPPPSSYMVNSLAWSPDGRRIAVNLTTQKPASEDAPATAVKAIALLDDDGQEIKVAGAKTRFIENAVGGAWLADGQTVVYLSGGGPYQIVRVRPSDGQTSTLFEGKSFDAVVWDAKRNQAFAVGRNLSISGRLALVQLDLVHEGVREIARLDAFQGKLTLSSSGTKIGFFVDGDTIEARDLANPSKPIRVRAGLGRFEWSPDERRVLLKRGPDEKSNDLVWVGLYDDSFVPALHGLDFHDFEIAPDGESIAVTEPGKRILKVFPLR